MRGVVAINQDPATSNLAIWAKAVLLGADNDGGTKAAAERLNVPDRVMRAIEAPLMTTDADLAGLTQTQTILTSFAPLLRNSSAFFRVLDQGMIRIPLRERVSWLTGAATMAVTNEGQAIRVSRIVSDSVHIAPMRSTGIVVLSKEFLTFLSTGGEAFLSMELRRALVASVDVGFFSIITDGDTPTNGSAGLTSEAAAIDLRWLFMHAGLTAESRPLLVMSPDVAVAASTLMSGEVFTFPGMSPTGGTMCGVAAMAVDALAAGTIGLLDAAGLAGDALGVTIKSTGHASVQLESAPDSPTTASTTMVNLWQDNLMGLQPEVYFGAERLRDNAWCKVTGVDWGGGADSPA